METRFIVLRVLSWLFRIIGWLGLAYAILNLAGILFFFSYATNLPYQLGLYGGIAVSSLITIAVGEAAQLLIEIAEKVLP